MISMKYAVSLCMICLVTTTHANTLSVYSLLYSWFINPSTANERPLLASGLRVDQIESLVTKNRSYKPEKSFEILTDIGGVDYCIGYATPASISKDSLYPCIIYLHGGLSSATDEKGKAAYDMFSFLAQTTPLFLASPSATKTSAWWTPTGLERILQCVRFMTIRYPIDPDRIILAGVSDGATGCFAAANSMPAPFAGFFAISGFGGMLEQLGIQLHPANMACRPLYIINGGQDRLTPLR